MTKAQSSTPTPAAAPEKPLALKLADNDVVEGTFDHLERGETEYGPCYVLVLGDPKLDGMLEPPKLEDGRPVSVWLFHAQLLGELRRLRPAKGDRIRIKRYGQRQSGRDARRTLTEYGVWNLTRPESAHVSWDEIAPTTEPRTGDFNDPPPF